MPNYYGRFWTDGADLTDVHLRGPAITGLRGLMIQMGDGTWTDINTSTQLVTKLTYIYTATANPSGPSDTTSGTEQIHVAAVGAVAGGSVKFIRKATEQLRTVTAGATWNYTMLGRM